MRSGVPRPARLARIADLFAGHAAAARRPLTTYLVLRLGPDPCKITDDEQLVIDLLEQRLMLLLRP